METPNQCIECSNKINRFYKAKKCYVCGKDICTRCIQKDRFCDACNSKLPKDIKQKYRVYNILPSAVITVIACLCFSLALFFLIPWPTIKWEDTFWLAIPNLILLFLFPILIVISIFMPQLGNKLFFRWINKLENRDSIDKAIKEYQEGRYTPSSKLYIKKRKFIDFMLRTNNLAIFIPAIISNILLIVFWLIRKSPGFEDISVFAGYIAGISVIFNFLIIIIAMSFYKDKNSDTRKRRYFILIFININLFLIFLVYGLVIWVWVTLGGVLGVDPDFYSFLNGIHNIVFLILHSCMIILILILIKSKSALSIGEPSIFLQNIKRETNKLKKYSIIFTRFFLMGILSILFLAFIIFSMIILIGDQFMFFSYFSIALIIGGYVPFCIWFAKIIGKKQNRGHKQRFWTIINITVIITAINLVPIVSTPIYTNMSIEAQFDEVFGEDWRSEITEKEYAKMRKYQYSLFDNLFSFDVESNAKYDIKYITDYPSQVKKNKSVIEHNFYFDAYLPPNIKFGNKSNDEKLLPVIIMMHGEVEDKGPWNANITSQYLANQGYLVCDMNYGYITENGHGKNYNGYTIRQVVEQIGNFTKFLYRNRNYYHADLSRTYFSGRHLGGGYALICGLGYNTTLRGVFSDEMKVRGVIPYYPISDLGTDETNLYSVFNGRGYPFMNGSSDPDDDNYDPDWINLNPIEIIDNDISPEGSLPPVFIISGTHDWLIPVRYTENFVSEMKENGHDIIVGYYLLGHDGFDGCHWSPWGQSIIYYYERFLALTH